jgi:hypothetical protein
MISDSLLKLQDNLSEDEEIKRLSQSLTPKSLHRDPEPEANA